MYTLDFQSFALKQVPAEDVACSGITRLGTTAQLLARHAGLEFELLII